LLPGTLLLAAALATACASTTLTSSWRSRDHPGGVFRSLLVVRLSEHPGVRASHEEGMAARLAALGVQARARGEARPDAGALEPGAVRSLAHAHRVEGVLATHRVSVRRELDVVRRGGSPGSPYLYDSFYGPFYDPFWGDVTTVRETEILALETNLYDAEGRLVWSAVTETWGPLARGVLAEEVTRLVTEALVREGLAPGPAGDAGDAAPDQASAVGSASASARPWARGSSTVKVVPSPSLDST